MKNLLILAALIGMTVSLTGCSEAPTGNDDPVLHQESGPPAKEGPKPDAKSK